MTAISLPRKKLQKSTLFQENRILIHYPVRNQRSTEIISFVFSSSFQYFNILEYPRVYSSPGVLMGTICPSSLTTLTLAKIQLIRLKCVSKGLLMIPQCNRQEILWLSVALLTDHQNIRRKSLGWFPSFHMPPEKYQRNKLFSRQVINSIRDNYTTKSFMWRS